MTRKTRRQDRRRVSAAPVAKGEHCARCGTAKADVLCTAQCCPFAGRPPAKREIVLREWSVDP